MSDEWQKEREREGTASKGKQTRGTMVLIYDQPEKNVPEKGGTKAWSRTMSVVKNSSFLMTREEGVNPWFDYWALQACQICWKNSPTKKRADVPKPSPGGSDQFLEYWGIGGEDHTA